MVRFDLNNLGLRKSQVTLLQSAVVTGWNSRIARLSVTLFSLSGEIFVTGLVIAGSCYFFTHNQQQEECGPVSASRWLKTSFFVKIDKEGENQIKREREVT